jgi:hypothetical protein
MATSVYQINKGINKPIEFKGLKAQYIWYLCGGLVALLILFAIMIKAFYQGVVKGSLMSVHISIIIVISC